MDRNSIEAWYRRLQDSWCAALERADGTSHFGADPWDRPGGGGGETRILSGSGPLEKAAVNVSAVWGETPRGLSEDLEGQRFFATGISTIVHPSNPHAPTFHANLRYFESGEARWFGGGADLTPSYLYEEDARHFHRVLRDVCDRHPAADYPAFKARCDEYFHLPHRGEARGVGGVLFDRLSDEPEGVWAFQRDLGDALALAYLPILERRHQTSFGESERHWQEIRRGRYVEFNLIWDRGTRFGLETGGRTESVLSSLPPQARWDYAAEPPPDTPESALLKMLRSPARDWA